MPRQQKSGDNDPPSESTGEHRPKHISIGDNNLAIECAEGLGGLIFGICGAACIEGGFHFLGIVFYLLTVLCGIAFVAHKAKKHEWPHRKLALGIVLPLIVILFGVLALHPKSEPARTAIASPMAPTAKTGATEPELPRGHETDDSNKHLAKLKDSHEKIEADARGMEALSEALLKGEELRAFEINDESGDIANKSRRNAQALSDVTPVHIFGIIQHSPGIEIDSVENLYKGVSVNWQLYFKSVKVDSKGDCSVDFDVIETTDEKVLYPWVMSSMMLEGNELLRTAKRGGKYEVSGIIMMTTPVFILLKVTSIKAM